MNRQAKGVRRETQVKELLEAQGYYVMRSSGSHGAADIIALRSKEAPLLIQVKSNSGPGALEREELEELSRSLPDCRVQIWIIKDRVKLPLVKEV